MNEHEHSGCRQLLGSLSDYIDGEASRELCREIEEHIAGCPNCRVVVDTLRRTISLYRSNSEQAGLPEEVRERLFKVLKLDDLIRH